MDIPFHPSMVERITENRSRLSWARKTIPLRSSTIFNRAKHSEDWHQSIDATAGVIHPSDPKFPYGSLRNHTEAYLNRKNKISQADADIRLAILVGAHDARDIAVAASAHAMSATRLRALLSADLNVMHGSYFGLKMWLQCIIAANYGNPASVTDLEAQWARMLLPFATQGPRAAEWYLVGMYRALREVNIPNLSILPEFAILMRRSIADYSARLEGYRLKCQWVRAYDAVLWMMDLARTPSAITAPGRLLPEHVLDSEFPMWRLWARWKPDTNHIKILASTESERLAILPELMSLEGPDVITGTACTLREGLVAQYGGAKALLRWRGILVEVPGGTKEGLQNILKRAIGALEKVSAVPNARIHTVFELFKDLVVIRPITASNLDVLEATFRIPYSSDNDVYNAVREIYTDRDRLGRQHLLILQCLMRSFDDDNSEQLRTIFLQGWLYQGIEDCVRECQKAVQTRIDQGLPWTNLATEYHTFCTTLKASERYWPMAYQTMKVPAQWPTREELKTVIEIYDAARMQRYNTDQEASANIARVEITNDTTKQTTRVSVPDYLIGKNKKTRQLLEEYIEGYCINRLLDGKAINHASQCTMTAILHVWESTPKPCIDIERRELALLISHSVESDFILRCRCLSEIASGELMHTPTTFVRDLINILHQSEKGLSKAIVAFTGLLAGRETTKLCWKHLLYSWLERQHQFGVQKEPDVIEYSLQSMKAVEWLVFMDCIKEHLAELVLSNSDHKSTPLILRPTILEYQGKVSRYTNTLTRLEAVLGENRDPIRCLLSPDLQAENLLAILYSLQIVEGKPVEVLMQRAVGKLSSKEKNDLEIKNCLLNLAAATPETIESCAKLWDANMGYLDLPRLSTPVPVAAQVQSPPHSAIGAALIACTVTSLHVVHPSQEKSKLAPVVFTPLDRRNIPVAVVEVMVAGWIFNDYINEQDRLAVVSFAVLLGIDTHTCGTSAWNSKLAEAAKFWQNIEDEIDREATRLVGLQKTLKARDPTGTRLLLQELGITVNSALDDEIHGLPTGIVDVVERIGEDDVEIGFSLTTITELQRRALGIPQGASSLILRLSQYSSRVLSPSFCLHFNNDKTLATLTHIPWQCSQGSRAPYENVCITTQTAFVWQLNRMLYTRLKTGNIGIAELYKLVTKKMKDLGNVCISCETLHDAKHAQLRRATPCGLLACARLWYQLPLDVRIPEIRTDAFVVDAMLTAVYAAAMSGRTELLPSCPIYSTEAVKTILNALPSLKILSRTTNISAELKRCHVDAEKLVSWACVHHRGYITTASGLCKVPTMPAGTHQFVLANASPKLESDFVAQLPRYNPKTTVLFHGTTFDRLPAILAQGLKVCSGTTLQRTGAAHGKGIYMAEEPATSMTYASATTSWRNSGLTNMRLLLGCEVVGNGRHVSPGIHVLTDEKSVMVRYVFFLTSNASTPIRHHVVSAMTSGMSALRTGAV